MIDHDTSCKAILTASYRFLSANSVFCSNLGYSLPELESLTVEKLLHPEHLKQFYSSKLEFDEKRIDCFEVNLDIITKNRKRFSTQMKFEWLGVVDSQSEISAHILLTTNCRSEEQRYQQTQWFLEKTFDTIDQGVTIYDNEFRLVAWNKRYESYQIFPPEFLKHGTLLFDAYKAVAKLGVFGPGDPEQHANEHIEQIRSGQIKPVEELTSFDGRTIEIRRYLMPEGGLVAVFSDITNQRKAEAQLRQAQKMDAVGQLTGGIAHDFNNILSVIIGSLYLLERDKEFEQPALEHVKTIQQVSKRGVDLVRQLLAFSRSEATNNKIVNINRMIQSMQSLITHSLTPQVEIETQFSASLWLTEIDPGEFEDVLINLILNARDAMGGRGKLTIETSNCEVDEDFCSINPSAIPGEYVQLIISDTGEGMTPEQQEKIFEPFYTTKTKGRGTGLGLALVFGFVTRSRGFIKLYSEKGIGSTFRIYLPRASEQIECDNTKEQEDRELPTGNEVILVVDDEEQLVKIARESLQGLGYQVFTALNGLQALEMLTEQSKFDLLFSDVVMPGGMTGYELAEQAKKYDPKLKILLTSGFSEAAVARNGQAIFKANLLDKPYTQYELARRVRQLLDS